MEILPLYKMIVELKDVFTKLTYSMVAHSSLRIETSQTIYLLSQRDSFSLSNKWIHSCLGWIGMKVTTLIYTTPHPQ